MPSNPRAAALRAPALALAVALAAGPTPGCGDDGGAAGGSPPYDWCRADAPPDGDCFAARRDPSSARVALARAIGDHLVATRDPTALPWDWGEAVLMLGLAQLHAVTGDAAYQGFYRAWMDHHVAAGYRIWSSDTCAPAALAEVLLVETGDPAYQAVVDDALRYLDEEALRTPEGGLNHHGTEDFLGVALWADSLFMFGNVLTREGERTGAAAPLDAWADQYGIFAALMQGASGFFKHAVYSIFPQTDGIYWARGNAWVAAAAYDHLRVRRARGEGLPAVEASARRLVDAALAAQDAASGLWWTVLNRPGETYLETSAGALFAFAMARGFRYGWLPAEVLPAVEAAMAGVEARIVTGEDGAPVVTGISGPTTVGDLEYYAAVPVGDDISYGVGAVLLALTETSGLPAP